MIAVRVLTNDNHLFLLRGFAYLFNKYWQDPYIAPDHRCPVEVVGFNAPRFSMPVNFRFRSMGTTNAPAKLWSNSLIEYLKSSECSNLSYFILMLEDYWLYQDVPYGDFLHLCLYMMEDPSVLRMDLTADRMGFKHTKIDEVKQYDIIEADMRSEYLMSFQTGIWSKELLLGILREGEDPWESEINGTYRVREQGLKVLGTLQSPVKYTPIYRSKKGRYNFSKVNPEDLKYIKNKKWI